MEGQGLWWDPWWRQWRFGANYRASMEAYVAMLNEEPRVNGKAARSSVPDWSRRGWDPEFAVYYEQSQTEGAAE